MNFKRILGTAALVFAAVLGSGCVERIESGHVGLRVDINKQIQGTELMEGSWNQTIVGSVLEFPVRDIAGQVVDQKPQTKENVALDDADLWYTYSVNPTAVSDLWVKRPRSFHLYHEKGDIFLMRLYMDRVVNNALFKAVRHYAMKEVNDARAEIESQIKADVTAQLKADGLDTSLHLTTVQVKALTPPKSVLDSYAAVVRSQNDLAVKQNEVEIAKKEAERMQALAVNAEKSIAYMNAQANLNVSEGIKAGKVNTVVVPFDFKGIVNAK